MADENRARHAFGNSENLQNALNSGVVDAYDILFLDGDTNPKVGWVDKNNLVKIVDTECIVVVEDEALPETGVTGKVYIFDEEAYFWNGAKFTSISKSADLSALEEEIATKVDEATVDSKIETAVNKAVSVEIVEF